MLTAPQNALLGPLRSRMLDCLGANDRWSTVPFSPQMDSDVRAAYRQFVRALGERLASASDPITISLLAAARLVDGDIEGAVVIVDHLPARPAPKDHGAGHCLKAPLDALRATLPLPEELLDTRKWLGGSAEQRALRGWLRAHAPHLVWDEARLTYTRPA